MYNKKKENNIKFNLFTGWQPHQKTTSLEYNLNKILLLGLFKNIVPLGALALVHLCKAEHSYRWTQTRGYYELKAKLEIVLIKQMLLKSLLSYETTWTMVNSNLVFFKLLSPNKSSMTLVSCAFSLQKGAGQSHCLGCRNPNSSVLVQSAQASELRK